jgi:hypothetical protein
MKKTNVWMLTAALAVTVLLATSALAQTTRPAVEPGVKEVTATPGEYCGICESKRNVNELVPWMNWGFDIRAREEYIKNATLNQNATTGLGNEDLWTRIRPRLWTQIKPVEDLDLSVNARLIWEYWMICKPDTMPSTPDTVVTFDDLNVRWANIGDMPLAVTIGRQQMRFGDGWLIFEGTPGDGSRSVYFDAVRGTYTAEEMNTTFDAVYVENRGDSQDSLIPNFNETQAAGVKGRYTAENNERGIILYASNKSIQSTTIDPYFIYYHAGALEGAPGVEVPGTFADIYTLGLRVAGDMTDNIQGRAEGAFQFGNSQIGSSFAPESSSHSVCGAWGLNSRLTYNWHDELDTAAWGGYEVRSGGKDPAQDFNILWGRYPQWSDLYNGYVDSIDGRPASSSNLHRLYVGAGFTPCKPLTFQANYNLLFVYNDNVTSPAIADGSNCFRGQLVTALLKYQFSEHVAGHLQGEVFFPGDYYSNDNNDVALFARYEIVFTW